MKKLIKIKYIAQELVVAPATVYRWFQGLHRITAENAVKLETITRIKAEAWMLPEKYKNPYFKTKEKQND